MQKQLQDKLQVASRKTRLMKSNLSGQTFSRTWLEAEWGRTHLQGLAKPPIEMWVINDKLKIND